MQKTLLVFVKYPDPGKVKTRIGQSLGLKRAAQLYRALVHTVFGILAPLRTRYRIIVAHDPPMDQNAFIDWLGPEWEYIPQTGQTLTERLSHAFSYALQTKPAAPAIVIGTDCIALTDELLQKAFEHLALFDLVIGPATDGGYYLLGMKAYYPDIFTRIEWSTPRVLDQTLRRASEAGLTVSLLPPLSDIDTVEDIPSHFVF